MAAAVASFPFFARRIEGGPVFAFTFVGFFGHRRHRGYVILETLRQTRQHKPYPRHSYADDCFLCPVKARGRKD